MATLNTLRTRGGIIVSIVIGIALLAFLLGDLASSGSGLMNEKKTRVGEIDGNKIGYIEFSNKADLLTQVAQAMSGKDALTTEEQDAARNMAWEAMVMKYSYEPGFENMGLIVGEAEQVDMVSGMYLSPVIAGTFANRSTGAFDPVMLKQFIANIDADQSGRSMMLWDYLKSQMINQREMSKYLSLLSKGMFVTDLEVNQALAATNNSYSARYVQQGFATIADSTIKVSDSDIKKYYADHKDMFKQGDSRDIEYVVFDLLPSQADYADAKKYIDEISVEFAQSETPMQYATLNSQEQADTRYYKAADLDPAISAVVFGGSEMYGPVLNGDTYTIARRSEIKSLPDSIGAMHILLPATDVARADSLVGVIKAGGNFAALANQFSMDQNANQRGGDLGIFAPDQMIPEFSEACMSAGTGDVFTVKSQYGTHVVKLTYKSPLVAKAQVATIKYKVEPSSFTQQSTYGEVSKFIASAAGSYENFKKAATDGALAKRVARIKNSDRNVSGMDDSRELVRWAFNGEKGNVSQVMEISGDYVVAAITEVRVDGIAPVDQVAADIKTILVQKKKGEILAEKMNGSSLDQVASALGTEVAPIADLQFGSFYVEGVGVEQKLVGAICGGAAVNVLSKPVVGTSGVFMFDVTNIAPLENSTFESEKVRMDAMTQAYLAERINQAMIEQSKIKDWRVKFF